MPEVIIIGGGFSGLMMAIRKPDFKFMMPVLTHAHLSELRRKLMMQDFLLIEKSSSFGGVWANNRYPGVACDIPTAFYSPSFAAEHWDGLFASGSSIQSYAERLAYTYHLESNTRFHSQVVSAQWNATTERWTVQIQTLSPSKSEKEVTQYVCKILVSAAGNLSVPNPVTIAGHEIFQGRIVHTGAYDELLDLTGKKVVVLGNGCTSQQLVPAIAPHVSHLTIFGPSKHWYLPRPRLPMPWLINAMSKYTTIGKKVLRFSIFTACEDGFRAMGWKSGEGYRKKMEKVSADYIAKTAPAKYRELLTPAFAFGAKRLIFDDGFLAALHRPNVDFFCERVKEIVKDGVITNDGRKILADVIIAATGFKAQEYLKHIQITGQEGADLQEHMHGSGQGLTSYKGTFYSSFPNFATLYGPNLGTGHSSAIFTQECQIDMVLRIMIAPVLQEEDVDYVVVRPEREREWQKWLRDEMKNTVWEKAQSGAWYNDQQGLCTTLYPRSQLHLWWSFKRTSLRDFLYMPRDSKTLYGSTKELETISVIVLLVIFLVLLFLFLR